MNPLFIVFEGIDGSGKSTQADLFYNKLNSLGLKPVKLFEPTNGPAGIEIRNQLKKKSMPSPEAMLELFIKDREYDLAANIQPAFNNGSIIVMDRYYHSNAAYQGAMGLDPEFILEQNISKNFPKPDRVYFIDIPVKTAIARIKSRNSGPDEIFEKEKFLLNVLDNYLDLIDETFAVINGNNDPEIIAEEIFSDFLNKFPDVI
jgi:dTMP kinase